VAVLIVLENGSEKLKINRETHSRIDRQQKCSYSLGLDFYIFGEVIIQLLLRNKNYNYLNVVSGIYVGNLSFHDLNNVVNKFFENPKVISILDNVVTFFHNDGIDSFYFIPQFNPEKLNDVYGFTIDQIYYNPKTDQIIDTSGRGMNDILSTPIQIKSTVPAEKWNETTLSNFLNKIGFFYDAEISHDDLSDLKRKDFEKPPNIKNILRLNRPGYAFRAMIEICPQAKLWLFDMIIQFLSQWNMKLRDNMRPSQVFTEEKLKLLDLYSDYFNTSGSPSEKRNRDRILAKLLVDI